jgi:hypothetical protein
MEHASRSAKPLSRRVRVSSCAVAVTLLIFSRESALRPPRECTVRKSERFCSTSRRRGSISPIKKRTARRPSIVPEQQKAPTERGFSLQAIWGSDALFQARVISRPSSLGMIDRLSSSLARALLHGARVSCAHHCPLRFHASASRPSGQWSDDDFDVLANGEVIGRICIYKANAAPVGSPWMWTLAFWHHDGRSTTHGYAATREPAMAAFAKSWRGEQKTK